MPLAIKYQKSGHYNERPAAAAADTLVIHSMYAREHRAKFNPLICIRVLNECRVSAHYLIARDGRIWNMVAEDKRAWHAGLSKMPARLGARENVNNFSIGVELIGSPESGFTRRQYKNLAALTRQLLKRHPLRFIVGHEHIAPGRKEDPGSNFDWQLYKELLGAAGQGLKFARGRGSP